ncbi:MAG TPA: PaaI family thioesterase [Pseudonocardia sp.]|nr:PaaI family thioesterase [Pseudonocardia sp.]
MTLSDPATRPGAAEIRERVHTWADPALTAASAAGVEGLEFLRRMVAGEVPPPPIATTLGFSAHEVERGRVVFGMEPSEFHYNPIGSVHGGVFATLLDSAAGCAVHSALPAGAYYTSLDLSVKFLRGLTVGSGPVRCEGVVVHLGGRTALAEARLTDGRGRLCAHATSTCMVFRPQG